MGLRTQRGARGIVGLAAGLFGAAAVGGLSAAAQDRSVSALEVADRNQDGVVDRREFGERMVDVFFLLDADRSGGLTPSELRGASDGALRRADRDGDGVLDTEEFLEARSADFERADRDDDGTLSPAEVEAYDRARAAE